MNLFVLIQLGLSFFFHAVVAGFAFLAILWVLKFTDSINLIIAVILSIVIALLVVLIPNGWEYIFSTETEISLAKRDIMSLVPSPAIYQYLIANMLSVIFGYIVAYIAFSYKTITDTWR